MTPFEAKVFAAVEVLCQDRASVTLAEIQQKAGGHANNVGTYLQRLMAAGIIRRRRVKIRKTNYMGKAWIYHYYPVKPSSAVKVIVCLPGYAEGYGLDRGDVGKRGSTLNQSDPWC